MSKIRFPTELTLEGSWSDLLVLPLVVDKIALCNKSLFADFTFKRFLALIIFDVLWKNSLKNYLEFLWDIKYILYYVLVSFYKIKTDQTKAYLMFYSYMFVYTSFIEGLFAYRARCIQWTLFVGWNKRFLMFKTNVTC